MHTSNQRSRPKDAPVGEQQPRALFVWRDRNVMGTHEGHKLLHTVREEDAPCASRPVQRVLSRHIDVQLQRLLDAIAVDALERPFCFCKSSR